MNDLQIAYFLAAAENLSFTKTANENYVSQPAVSKQISAMEEEIGAILFERKHNLMSLTNAGILFADYFKRQRQDLHLVTQQARGFQVNKEICLRLGIGSGWTLSDFLPDLVANMVVKGIKIQMHIENYEFHEIIPALSDNEIDIGITLHTSVIDLPTMEHYRFTEVPRVLIYSEAHPLARHTTLSPLDFKDELFFVTLPEKIASIVELVKSFCDPYGFIPKIRSVKSNEALFMNVLNGFGVAIVDSWAAKTGREVFRHIPLDTNHAISAVWRRNKTNTALPLFLQELAAIFDPDGNRKFYSD
ncbi:LysR family transcriptional regulator [Lachnospiraceae bacterium ZAX-1]